MKKTDRTSLGDRMKKYENINRTYLIPKLPTILRLDGRAFHTFTKKFKRPFDQELIELMNQTAIHLCNTIQGAKFAYVQSDEISIYLSDLDSIEQTMWYDGNIQKIVSVAASLASTIFNQLAFINLGKNNQLTLENVKNLKLAEFDARVFQLPNQSEAINCFIWRQQDWNRYDISEKNGRLITKKIFINDIESVGREYDGTDKIWYQPDNQSTFYPSKHGRALEWNMTKHGWEDWCDIEIKKIRSVWTAEGTEPFVDNKQTLLNLL